MRKLIKHYENYLSLYFKTYKQNNKMKKKIVFELTLGSTEDFEGTQEEFKLEVAKWMGDIEGDVIDNLTGKVFGCIKVLHVA